jgi:aminoglycoside phosphotransferase family enzyme/predicted kinase
VPSVHTTNRTIVDWGSQDSLVAAMMDPAFYPKPPDEVTHKETHISHLFFVGDLVYKVKKPIRYSFLDYSTLAKRRHYLQEEFRLNRRLTPSVYLGVMPISFNESWRLGGWAEPTEYTLVMRRLPEKRMLPFLLETKQVTPEMIRKLAELLVSFHGTAEAVLEINPSDYVSSLEQQWSENLADLEPFVAGRADREALQSIRSFGAEFIEVHKDLLARRAVEGWIRDVHGDLHAEHVCFAPEGIQIFDCIEFSVKLRCCDLASEIAFLLMDLTVRGGESLREPFIARYRELLSDPDLPRLLPFFECYRALVRAKVHALRRRQWNDEAAHYFRHAKRLAWQPLQPFLVLICGLSGSGKSTLARELGEQLGMPLIHSDAERKAMAGTADRRVVPLNQGIYSRDMTGQTYAKMAREAEKHILKGKGAILDATFARQAYRVKMVRLAEKHKVPVFFIRCFATDELTHRRLAARAAEGRDVSNGRWEIYLNQKTAHEPLDEISSAQRLDLDTALPVEDLGRAVEIFLRSRLKQGS